MYLSLNQSSKSKAGPLNSRQKKSIFAVPDSLEGRVSCLLTKTEKKQTQ